MSKIGIICAKARADEQEERDYFRAVHLLIWIISYSQGPFCEGLFLVMDGNLGILMLFIFVGFFVLGWGRNMKGLLLLVQNTIQIK